MTASTMSSNASDNGKRPTWRTLTEILRESIASGEFVPGQRLVEADLCEQYDATRGAVRSALQELASESLVETHRHKGARVRAVSVAAAIEITEVRAVLEGFSAAKAAERLTPAQAEVLREIGVTMRTAVEKGDYDQYSELNAKMHAMVREIAAHPTSEDIIVRLRAQVVRHQFRLSRRPGRPSQSLPQHEAIIAAILARDPQAAREAMERHLHSVAEALAETEQAGR
jgi:DNA-binding GntR family transcriptional regulator